MTQTAQLTIPAIVIDGAAFGPSAPIALLRAAHPFPVA
jgi:hypothetical protein